MNIHPLHFCQDKITFCCINFVLLSEKSLAFFQDNTALWMTVSLFSLPTENFPNFVLSEPEVL